MKLSIVIPCYKEADNIPKLLAAYDREITRSDVEVIIVNDGSPDNSAKVLQALQPTYQRFLTVVTYEKNRGYGGAILTGLAKARGTFIGWTHGDLQTPPRDVIRALEIIEQHQNDPRLYVKGTRIGRPLFDQIFTFGMSVFETIFLRRWLFDINAQPNVFHRDFFTAWQEPPTDFSLDLYVFYMARLQNKQIVRFSVPFLQREHGTSSWNTGLASKWKFIKRTLKFSVALKRRLKQPPA